MRLEGTESILGTNGLTVLDFWRWANSDVMMNSARGVLAEYLVGAALDALGEMRIEWDAFDLKYRGHGVEVKSAAYIQSWQQKADSKIQFDIAPKLSWFADTNTYSPAKMRSASVYVFCLLAERDRTLVNPLNTDQWRFFVVGVPKLDALGEQQKLSLAALCRLSNECSYASLKDMIDRELDDLGIET